MTNGKKISDCWAPRVLSLSLAATPGADVAATECSDTAAGTVPHIPALPVFAFGSNAATSRIPHPLGGIPAAS